MLLRAPDFLKQNLSTATAARIIPGKFQTAALGSLEPDNPIRTATRLPRLATLLAEQCSLQCNLKNFSRGSGDNKTLGRVLTAK